MSNYTLSVTKVCFLVHLLLEGLQRSCGIFFVDIREWLGCSRQIATIPFALSKVVSGIVELFFRFQNNDGKPGPRIGWGCLLSAVGVGVCFLAIDIVWHSVFWGIIFGSGIGIASPLLLSLLSQNKENSAKLSLKSSGPSFGCIVLPYLINKLIDHYGLNGSYVILSGIILNILPFVLIAFYKISFHWPKTKWRLRRRSKRYEMSGNKEKSNDVSVYKLRNIREFYNQSFLENLEPDTLERVSEKEGSQNIQCMETIDILQPIIEAKFKMTNQVNNREAFGLNRICHHPEDSDQNGIHCMKLPETNGTEDISKISENYFNDKEIKSGVPENCEESNNNQYNIKEAEESVCENCSLKESVKSNEKEALEKSETANEDGHDHPPAETTLNQTFQIKREFSKQSSNEFRKDFPFDNQHNKKEVKESVCENGCLKEDEISNERKTLEKNKTANEDEEYHSPVITTINQTFQIKKEFSNKHRNKLSNEFRKSFSLDNQLNKQVAKENVCENCCLKEDEKSIEKNSVEKSETTNEDDQGQPPIITTINQTFQVKKEFSKHTNQSSKEFRKSFPLEIKVHVVECTITTTDDFSLPERSKLSANRNGYRRHSNSLITSSYENIDFTQLFQNNSSSPLHKQQWNYASRMCLITEEGEDDSESQNASSCIPEVETRANIDSSSKQRNFRQTFQELARPSYLAIIYASVIYEFSLAILLTIFSDFAKDTGDTTVTSSMVLITFGLGGVVGKLSFNHWGNRLLVDGSHAAAAVIFILNGLAVAGILWSINVAWLSGFYALLGFVENGVTMIIPKLISDYTDQKAKTSLYMICQSLSVIAFICIPCSIGQSRDVTGNYDGLLQVTSCMSVLCAVLCYFLPKWSGVQPIQDRSNGRDNIRV